MSSNATKYLRLRHRRHRNPWFLLLFLCFLSLSENTDFSIFLLFIFDLLFKDFPTNSISVVIFGSNLHIIHYFIDFFKLFFNLWDLKSFFSVFSQYFSDKLLNMLSFRLFLFLWFIKLWSISSVESNCISKFTRLNIDGIMMCLCHTTHWFRLNTLNVFILLSFLILIYQSSPLQFIFICHQLILEYTRSWINLLTNISI